MNRNGNKIQLLAIYFIGVVKSFMCNFHRNLGAARVMITETLLVRIISQTNRACCSFWCGWFILATESSTFFPAGTLALACWSQASFVKCMVSVKCVCWIPLHFPNQAVECYWTLCKSSCYFLLQLSISKSHSFPYLVIWRFSITAD